MLNNEFVQVGYETKILGHNNDSGLTSRIRSKPKVKTRPDTPFTGGKVALASATSFTFGVLTIFAASAIFDGWDEKQLTNISYDCLSTDFSVQECHSKETAVELLDVLSPISKPSLSVQQAIMTVAP